MRKIVMIVVVVLIVAVTADAGINSNIFFNNKIKITRDTKFVVLPFELTASWRNPPTDITRKMIETKNTEKCEISLFKAGVAVIERNRLDKVLSEQALSQTGITENDSIKIGKILSGDIVVMGIIPAWTYYKNVKRGHIEIIIKGVDVETGEVVFKAIFNSKFHTAEGKFRYDISQLETKIYKALGEKIKTEVERK
jgi:hypothetical protein